MNETEPLLRPKRIAIRRSANYWQPAVRQPPRATERRCEALATYVVTGGSMARTAAILGISRSTAKRHLADLRARFGLSTEQLIYVGRSGGWLQIPSFEPDDPTRRMARREPS